LDEPGEGFRMGDHSNVGAFSYIGCSGFVDIGHNVIMGPRVNVLAENHRFESMEQLIKDQGVDRSPIVIEDNCWIGAGATIVAGTRIRSGTVVAAGAVVTKDTPADSVVGGVPARVLCGRRGEAKAHAEKGALCTRTGRSL
jgi:acetyltransferase-like isoleucine patch superfamily enzyme